MKWKVLCVDDIESNLFTYKTILSRIEDIEVILVDSGKKALEVLLYEDINLILLDIQMPEMDGYEVAKLVKANKSTKEIPIIFITAVFKKEEFIEKGFSLGAVDYLTKPLDDNLLVNRIRLYLSVFYQRDIANENMQRFYDIAQSIGDGLYVLDRDLKLTFINKAALELLGYKKSELVGQEMHTITHYRDKNGDYRPSNKCEVHSALDSGTIVSIHDDVFVKKDSSSLYVSVVATPIMHNNVITGVAVLFKDISEQKRLQDLEEQKLQSEKEIVKALVEMIDKRDAYTAGHTLRVSKYCELIARKMNYSEAEIQLLTTAAHLHDIGKVATPDSILLKPAALGDDEYDIIKLHLTNGYNLLSQISNYKEIAEVMKYHHERYDGKGYPDGLSADEIPSLSRIMIVADAFDAMTTNRIYKNKKSVDEALHEIQELSQIQFHPEVVEVAVKMLKDIKIEDYIDQLPKDNIDESRYAYYYKDHLTDLFTIDYLPSLIDKLYYGKKLYLYKIKLNNFHKYNKEFSWTEGNNALIKLLNFRT